MAKDPAFLFYSKDWYEGTRMMLPEERACYIDLLVYQHQNGGFIPNDLRRLTMYCSGCDVPTIQNVLDQKFEQTPNGWLNQKLDHLVNERSMGKPKKIASACFAGLISSSKLNKKQIIYLKKRFQILEFIQNVDGIITDETIIKSNVREWFNRMLDQMVENLANANAIAIVNANINNRKGGMGEKHVGEPVLTILELYSAIETEITWKETICRNLKPVDSKFNLERLQDKIEQFFTILENRDDLDKTLKDFKQHFSSWLNIEISKELKNQKNEKNVGKSKVGYSDDFLRKVANKVQS